MHSSRGPFIYGDVQVETPIQRALQMLPLTILPEEQSAKDQASGRGLQEAKNEQPHA